MKQSWQKRGSRAVWGHGVGPGTFRACDGSEATEDKPPLLRVRSALVLLL